MFVYKSPIKYFTVYLITRVSVPNSSGALRVIGYRYYESCSLPLRARRFGWKKILFDSIRFTIVAFLGAEAIYDKL